MTSTIIEVQPATDEQIAKWGSEWMEVHPGHPALRLIARIKAEQAASKQARESAIRECSASLELYASSYSTMSKIGDGKVSASDVAYDMRHNIIGSNFAALLSNGKEDE